MNKLPDPLLENINSFLLPNEISIMILNKYTHNIFKDLVKIYKINSKMFYIFQSNYHRLKFTYQLSIQIFNNDNIALYKVTVVIGFQNRVGDLSIRFANAVGISISSIKLSYKIIRILVVGDVVRRTHYILVSGKG